MARDILLDSYQSKLDDLYQEYDRVQERLRTVQDASIEMKLELRIEQIGQKVNELQRQIREHQENRERQLHVNSFENLILILKNAESQIDRMIQAYQKTIFHWQVEVDSRVNKIDLIITELVRIPHGNSSYTAEEEFLAHLFMMSDRLLAQALNQWAIEYRSGRNLRQLHQEIQELDNQRLENAKPGIFITIVRSDEASTQSQLGETFYQINAWLVEDIETYQKHKTGYHALIVPGSSAAEPFSLESLLQAFPRLIQGFLIQKNQRCPSCENYPEVHVFLPLELMHLGVDVWQLNPEQRRRPEYLGHDHVVVVRCANRYDGNYTKAPSWRRFWNTRQPPLGQALANEVFVSGHDDDIDALIELLDDAVGDDRLMGLHLTQAPIDTEAMCYELLDSGLPLAIWPRENLLNNAHAVDLPALLADCCLENLPRTVQKKRHETRGSKNTPDRHIGHHLSLLWDNPHLVPPKSA
jgi:vWA-MoxR associated protein C-terminal domain